MQQLRDGNSPFRSLMRTYAGRKVYLLRLPGNQGDELIVRGALYSLEMSQVKLVGDPAEADLILINGGGSFNTFWRGALDYTMDLRGQFPETHVVVGPQTCSFNDEMVKDLQAVSKIGSAPLTFFARGRPSYELFTKYLREASPNVSVRLSPDLAFELIGSDWISERRKRKRADHLLFAFRSDVESPFPRLRQVAWTQRKYEWANRRLQTFAIKVIRRLVQLQRIPVGRAIVRDYLGGKVSDRPARYSDVSCLKTFDQFIDTIERSSLVVTDRLHVVIYSYLMDIPVALVIGDHYHKNRGIYDLCMDHVGSPVRLYGIDGRPIEKSPLDD
ncbi:MAG: polysaccharide pyruvyl transferase family protein [Planctomycetota bacterium]|nr:polysaccharide pyruvyl transferase family protein [Planctomycetota bacterium]